MLHLSVSGVSLGKRSVAEIGFKVRRREPIATALGLGVSGVRPVVGGGGIVDSSKSAERRRVVFVLDRCLSRLGCSGG